jgi:DNA polymerase sigma
MELQNTAIIPIINTFCPQFSFFIDLSPNNYNLNNGYKC